MRVDLFDFDLPSERIALEPARPRDAARLLVVTPGAHPPLTDRGMADLPSYVRRGDVLVLNDTRVLPAELSGVRKRPAPATHKPASPALALVGPPENEARIGVTLTKRLGDARWRALARPAKRLRAGDRIRFGNQNGACALTDVEATVEAKGDEGMITLAFNRTGAYLDEALQAIGRPPLPPYIAGKRPPLATDAADYQTVYAAHEGAVAAPTAGLHFTQALLAAIKARGASLEFITLHVGTGTFLPVKTEETGDHVMHAEWGEINAACAARLNQVRSAGGRVIAVGTTSLRLLESAARSNGALAPFRGETSIFITPGYRFLAADALLTNFHLPRSTLFMLVSAFCGLATMRHAYAHAIAAGYRFYSFGDACLLSPAPQGPVAR